jgi:hypothetical protein
MWLTSVMHPDNLIFIVLVVVVTLVRLFVKMAQSSGQDSKRPNASDRPIPRSNETDSQEERIRRFLEALGQPTNSKPPPKVTPKRPRQTQPRAFPTPTLPPLTTFPPPESPLPPVIETPPPLAVEPKRVFIPAPTLEPGFEVRQVSLQPSKTAGPQQQPSLSGHPAFALRFESTQDLRNAIVLREILGPPRSLQTRDIGALL